MTDLCGAKNRRGNPCGKSAGWGTDHLGYGHCRLHGGASPGGRVYASKLAAAAASAKFGIAIETDPREALATVVNILAGQVAFLNEKVAEIAEGEAFAEGDLHPTLRALNTLLDQWRVAAKTASDADVEGRRLELDELATQGVADFIRSVLDELHLTDEQRALLPEAMRMHVGLIEALAERPRELIA